MQARPPSQGARSDGPGADRLGEQLKCYFDHLTAGPTPDRLIKLTEALDAAFERGEFRCRNRRVG